MLRHFRISVLIRTALLAITLSLVVYLLLETAFTASAVVVAFVAILQIVSFITYVEKTNAELGRFLRSVKYGDFSQSFSARGKGDSFEELSAAFGDVMTRFRETRAETEEQHLYLQTVIQHIGMGLIAFTGTGEVKMLNTAAKRLLNINALSNIRALEAVAPGLTATLQDLVAGKRTLVKIERDNELIQLAVYATEFKLREQHFTLVSLQNIRTELEEKEMEAYQKLIRVLTHEIMNSITPISSLASSVNDLLVSQKASKAERQEEEDVSRDVREAVQTIKKRSDGLLHFVEAYRNLTRIPKPKFKIVGVADLLRQVVTLIEAQNPVPHVKVERIVDPATLEVTADPDLIEQVLLNMLLNAFHAVREVSSPRIRIVAGMDRQGHVIIDVRDNGPGISEDAKDKIFVPFFTTKKDGSGIGLSLSKEIMRQHRGSIHVYSESGKETTFRLVF